MVGQESPGRHEQGHVGVVEREVDDVVDRPVDAPAVEAKDVLHPGAEPSGARAPRRRRCGVVDRGNVRAPHGHRVSTREAGSRFLACRGRVPSLDSRQSITELTASSTWQQPAPGPAFRRALCKTRCASQGADVQSLGNTVGALGQRFGLVSDQRGGAALGVSRRNVHFYLEQGLLHPPRRTGRTMAYYDDAHLAELSYIRAAREKGMPLLAIKEQLATQVARTDGWPQQRPPTLDAPRRRHKKSARLGRPPGQQDMRARILDVACRLS